MKLNTAMFLLLFLTGCALERASRVIYRSTVIHADGTKEITEVEARQPRNPAEGGGVSWTTNGTWSASVGQAQDAAAFEREKQDGKTDRFEKLMQWGCVGSLLAVGLLAGFLSNTLVSNKTAIMVIAVAAVFAVLVLWAPAMAGVMKWIGPACVVGAVVLVAFEWHSNRLKYGTSQEAPLG